MLAFHTAPAPVLRLPVATYRRRQLVAGLLLAVVAFLVLTFAAHALRSPGTHPAGGAGFGAQPIAQVQVVVEPGDTVWSIAEALAAGEDVRPVVDAIVEANGGATLVPGQRLDLTLP
jgi:hypothetical protein